MTMRRCPCLLAIALVIGCFKPSDDAGDEIGGTTDTTGDTTEDDTTTTTTESTTDDTTDTTDTTTGDGDAFVFATDPPDAYTRVDRMGMPAIATALITSKDMYNAANPVDDVDTVFVDEIIANLQGLHAALDDDLMGLGLVPCTPANAFIQAAPVVLPDTLEIDLSLPPGFPNGRRLGDRVIDITLAVVMLDLGVMGQDPGTFASIPVNPGANDVPFSPVFPYLVEPN